MKKRFLLLILLLLILLSCNSTKYEKNELGINGKVKKVTEITYREIKDTTGKLSNDTLSVVITFLNDNGKLKKSKTDIYISNVLAQTIDSRFIYNSKQQRIKEMATTLDSIEFEVEYEYKNNLLDRTLYKDTLDNIYNEYFELYFYDSFGKLKQRDYHSFSIDLEENDTITNLKAKFKYDNNEFLIESEWMSLDSIYNKKELYFKDKTGLLEKQFNYNNIGILIDSAFFKYEYDKNNNWIKRMEFKNDSLIKIKERIIE